MSLRRVTGDAAFAGDVAPRGLLHLVLRRAPHAHARIRSVDAAAALALPGVAAVLTTEDVPTLLPREVRFVGERVAVAAAEEAELARRAVDSVRIDFETLPAALDAGAAKDAAEGPGGGSVAARLSASEGDVEAALGRCDTVLERDWRIPFTPAISLEPPIATTWLDEDRRLVVRTSAESPFRVRAQLAERLGIPAARIRVVRPLVAGGSAGRSDLVVEDLCASVTLRTGRPARLALSAGEELTTAPGRPAQRVRVRLGLRERSIEAVALDLLVDLGADSENAEELLRSSARHALALYRSPALGLEAVAVRTNHPPASAPRGADAAAAFALECVVDDAAAAIGEDPAAFRGRHLRRPGDPGAELLTRLGEPAGAAESSGIAELLERDALAAHAAPDASAEPFRGASGIAVARRAQSEASLASAAASLRLLDDGSFHLAASHASASTDEAAYVQSAAAILGVPSQRIVCAAADTDSAAFEAGTPSPLLFGAELAVEDAARQVRDRVLDAGAVLLDARPGSVGLRDGAVHGPSGRSVGLAEIGTSALRAGRPIAAMATTPPGSVRPALAVARADVEVDRETGIVRIRRLAATLRGGPFPDPRAPTGVVEGALAMAVEQALAGGLAFDAEGRPLVRSFRAWPLVAAVDVPPLVVSFVAPRDGTARAGSAALADAAGRAALAAIAIAVARAIGGKPCALPLTPASLLEAASPP